MSIDWTKPIETVPCPRNPLPVECTLVNGKVGLLGRWIDQDDCVCGGGLWKVRPNGSFIDLNGAVRNVVAPASEYDPKRIPPEHEVVNFARAHSEKFSDLVCAMGFGLSRSELANQLEAKYAATLHDQFAMHAPPPPALWCGGDTSSASGYVVWARQYADVMMAAREQAA